jgi:hypothetical protein
MAATTVTPPEFSALVNESDYIVHAKVSSVLSEKRTASGGAAKIVTIVGLEVIEIVAGAPPKEIKLEMLGGKVGDEELVVAGMPQFTVGDEDILFVRGNGHSISPLYGMMHGRYPIGRDAASGRRFVARENGVPLSDPAEISLPMPKGGAAELLRRQRSVAEALAPEDFIRRIKAAITPEARLNRAK